MCNMMLKMVTEPHKEIHNEVKESVLRVYMEVGEMAWRLKSIAALAKEHSLVLNTLVGWCTITFNSNSRGSNSLFGTPWETAFTFVCTYTCTEMPPYV